MEFASLHKHGLVRVLNRGHPDVRSVPLIPVGRFTVNIFPGTLSSF